MYGFIGAMNVEVEGLIARMDEDRTASIGMDTFHCGKLFGHDVVIAKCGPGKINAAICACVMIQTYHPEWIINLGVAGSGEEGVDIGDMVIATSAVQHDCDTTPLGDSVGMVSKLNMVNLPCDEALREKMVKAARMLGGITVHEGVIATGDQFISTAERRRKIHELFRSKAVEMEGGAVAQVCAVFGTPCGILRSVSDNADGESTVSYPAFVETAAANSQKVVENLLRHCL